MYLEAFELLDVTCLPPVMGTEPGASGMVEKCFTTELMFPARGITFKRIDHAGLVVH